MKNFYSKIFEEISHILKQTDIVALEKIAKSLISTNKKK